MPSREGLPRHRLGTSSAAFNRVSTERPCEGDDLAALGTSNAVMRLMRTKEGIRLVGDGAELSLQLAESPL
jgi:hypothetical protein